MVAGGLMAGIVIGMVISPIRGGIGLEVSLGSHNGCGNYDNDCSKNNQKIMMFKRIKDGAYLRRLFSIPSFYSWSVCSLYQR